MRNTIIFILAVNVLIEYTYTVHLGEIFGLLITPNRIFKFIPVILFLLLLPFSQKKVLLYRPAILLLLTTFISIGNSFFDASTLGQTLDVWLRYISSFALVFIAGKSLKEEDYIKIFNLLLIFSLIPITISFLQYFNLYEYKDFDYVFGKKIGRVSGGYAKPVALMGILFYGYAFSLVMIFFSKKWYLKTIYASYITIAVIIILMTYHRASMIIVTVATLSVGWLYKKRAFTVAVITLLTLVLSYVVLEHVIELFRTLDTGSERSFMRGRGGTWTLYLTKYFDSSFLDILFGKGNAVMKINGEIHHEPHNDFIRIMIQYGIIGVMLYISLMVGFMKKSLKYAKKETNPTRKMIGILSFASGISLILYSMTIEPTRYPGFFWYYAAMMSFIIVHTNNNPPIRLSCR